MYTNQEIPHFPSISFKAFNWRGLKQERSTPLPSDDFLRRFGGVESGLFSSFTSFFRFLGVRCSSMLFVVTRTTTNQYLKTISVVISYLAVFETSIKIGPWLQPRHYGLFKIYTQNRNSKLHPKNYLAFFWNPSGIIIRL